MIYKFISNVPVNLRHKLEELFFFNKEQKKVYPKIEKALEKYGNPFIIENGGRYKIGLERLKDCQNLILIRKFSDDEKISGIILHSRTQKDKAEIIHIAVDNNKNNDNLNIMMNEILRIYKSIKGVEKLEITYIGKELKIH